MRTAFLAVARGEGERDRGPGAGVKSRWGKFAACTSAFIVGLNATGSLVWGWIAMLAVDLVIDRVRQRRPMKSWDDVPRRSSPDPIKGVKLAYPVLVGGRVKFHALARPVTYGTDEAATCDRVLLVRSTTELGMAGKGLLYRRVNHPVPEASCTCGFYAMKRRRNSKVRSLKKRTMLGTVAWARRVRHKGPLLPYALLEVELLGRVLVHEHGYRAGHQRVMKARLDARCSCCPRPAVGFFTGKFLAGGSIPVLSSTCGCQAPVRYTLADVRNMAGTEVVWDPDRKPLLTRRSNPR